MNIISRIAVQARNTINETQCNAILESSNPFSRATIQGHVTASGLVIQDGRALLIFHPYIKRWFQPGGHIDEGESPIETAIREVYEETGYVCALDADNLDPIDIDIHEIPENLKKGEGSHLHIDLLYRLKVLRQEKSVEDIQFRWFSFGEVENVRVQRALAGLA
jgi:8-oxo-dGTP pyrophosphatase MutT (NUDIX family)